MKAFQVLGKRFCTKNWNAEAGFREVAKNKISRNQICKEKKKNRLASTGPRSCCFFLIRG